MCTILPLVLNFGGLDIMVANADHLIAQYVCVCNMLYWIFINICFGPNVCIEVFCLLFQYFIWIVFQIKKAVGLKTINEKRLANETYFHNRVLYIINSYFLKFRLKGLKLAQG